MFASNQPMAPLQPENYMASAGAKLLDSGFNVLPIAPGEKFPGVCWFGVWRPMRNWDQYAGRLPSPLELQQWITWPGTGVGVPGGNVVAIDLDVLDANLGLEIDRLCRHHLGDTPALRIGLPPKRLLVFRTDTPFKGASFGALEVLCQGRQFVGYGIHPKTGQPYAWPDEGLADLDITHLPLVTADAVQTFVQAAMAEIPPELRAAPGRTLGISIAETDPTEVNRSVNDRRGTVEGVSKALGYIANDDLSYDDWIRVGLALKGALGEEGRSFFEGWSRRSTKYDPDTTVRAWNSMRPTRIGVGTIYYHAKEAGWCPPLSLELHQKSEERRCRFSKIFSR